MDIQNQISQEQRKTLLSAISAASAYVSTASGGTFEAFKEAFNASKFARDLALKEGGSGYGALADDLLHTMKEMSFSEARESAIDLESRDVDGIRAELKQAVVDAAAIANSLPESADFKRFLIDMARAVAETRTGGFLGFGSKSVIDDREQAALDELASVLGV